VPISFYKMFGYPTGVGCLVAKKSRLARLRRPWYAGGTITFSSVQGEGYYLTPGAAGFEDGTVDYLSIPAVTIGLRHLSRIGVDLIHTRVMCIAEWLLEELSVLRHTNGAPLVRIYGPTNGSRRGATIQFNLFDPYGRLLDGYAVERRANRLDVSLRTGCHCNPGARETALGFTEDEMVACFRDKDRIPFEQFVASIDGKTTGAVRASLGIASSFEDAYVLLEFVREHLDARAEQLQG
jgi:selenocysteine lyase/cysteine desulfurase